MVNKYSYYYKTLSVDGLIQNVSSQKSEVFPK